MTMFTPDQSRTLAQVFNKSEVFNKLFWDNPDEANRIRDDILDIELKGKKFTDLNADSVKALRQALEEFKIDKEKLFSEINWRV